MMILALMALLACVEWTAFARASYLGHVDTGDQAGFALGILFVVTVGIPITGVLLAAGTSAESHQRRSGLTRALIATALVAGAAFFFDFSAFYFTVGENPDAGSQPWTTRLFYAWHLVTMIAFAINLIGSAMIMRSTSVSPDGMRWFTGMLLATALVAAVQSAATLVTTGVGIIPFLIPSLAWIATLVRTASELRERPTVRAPA